MSYYETIFIVKPAVTDENLKKVIDKAKELVESNGGKVKDIENWGKRKLAYEVQKEKRGIYVLMRCFGNGKFVFPLERQYQIEDSIIKYITVKLDEKLAIPKAPVPETGAPEEKSPVKEREEHDDRL